MEPQVSTVLKIQRLRTRGEVVMPKKKKQPTKKKGNKKKSKKVLEGYYIDDKGLKILYKDKWGGLSI